MLSCRYHKLSTGRWVWRVFLPARTGLRATVLSLLMLLAMFP
jgi:hypothetical protein